MYCDAHVHLTDMTLENLQDMALANVRKVVSPVHLSAAKAVAPETIVDMWDVQLEKQLGRAKNSLIDAYAMIGISMVSTPRSGLDHLLDLLPSYLARPEVVAIGEVGFEPGSKTNNDPAYQQELLEYQIDIAKAAGVCLDLHLPNVADKKISVTEKCIELCLAHKIDMKKVIFDHCTDANIQMVIDAGAYAAISVQPWRKITPEMAAEWVIKYNSDLVFVDSDTSNLASDCLNVPKIACALQKKEAAPALIEKACFLNACNAYGLK